MEPVLAVDIGGSNCAVALVLDGDVLDSVVVATPAKAGPQAVVRRVVDAVEALLARASSSRAPTLLGVACAGAIKDGRMWPMSPELLPGWHGFPIEAELSSRLRLAAATLNDAQAAALGEARHGAGRGLSSFLFVTVSTGVGGGLVLAGQPWRGHSGLAGHVGHIRVGAEKLEDLVSGTALARRAASLGWSLDARGVVAAAVNGEVWAGDLVTGAAAALASVLRTVRVLVDVERVVLGGGLGLNPAFREAVVGALQLVPENERLTVVAAALGGDAGLVGAAEFVRL